MTTQRLQVYRCGVCGMLAEVIDGGAGELICCGRPMRVLRENVMDDQLAAHVPRIERADHGVRVVVGDAPHPMQTDHFIEWIELVAGDQSYRHFLRPGQDGETFFPVEAAEVSVRHYCNRHGLWKGQSP